MSSADDDADKSFEPTQKKLDDARKKGEIAKSVDLQTAAGYAGITSAFLLLGAASLEKFGSSMMILLDQSYDLSFLIFDGAPEAPMGGIFFTITMSLAPIFLLPIIAVLLVIFAQRGFVFAPTKLEPKLSKISPISNAKNKFGRSGFFEFGKSFTKLIIYSVVLGIFLNARLPEIVASTQSEPGIVVSLLADLCIAFLLVVVLIASTIGGIDAIWQHGEHRRKNMMSHKEIMDESKDAEGDPHLKAERRQRAQAIAMSQMMGDVPDADVIIVNPTHYAVALTWEKSVGGAPRCVAKGVDEVAARIRAVAIENGVPIHSDPPTARALHAVTEIGDEVSSEFYQPVAAAIRFAEDMRNRAQDRTW